VIHTAPEGYMPLVKANERCNVAQFDIESLFINTTWLRGHTHDGIHL